MQLATKTKELKGRGWDKRSKVLADDEYMEEISGERIPIEKVTEKDKTEKPRYFIPVILHNGKNYDVHHILKFHQDSTLSSEDDLRLIATNLEKFISVQIENLRITYSCQFLPGSLDSFVENLKKNREEKFIHTLRHFKDPVNQSLMLRKGVFSYGYMDSRKNFDDTQIPPIKMFYSKLSDTKCSDYEHAQTVWKTFRMVNMKQYHYLYLKTDVLLADVFRKL